jgi:4-hydroxy-3-methylbut-2-enyl diphosphate reductase
VQQLHKAGVNMIASLEETTGKVVAIPTHGVGPDTVSQMEARKLHIIDATCPIVKRAQLAVAKLARADFTIIIFGEEEHSEVKGLLGWAQGKGMAALSTKQIITATQDNVIASESKQSLPLSRLGVICQTTQSKASFTGFATQLVTTFIPKTNEIRIINTLCQAIQARLETATKLARKSQLIIVIGGHNSANTKRLAEACSSIVETRLVETAEEIAQSWLDGKHRIGITAGASTPDEAIQEVIAKLNSLA